MWPRLKNSPHTYAHEGLESIFLFEFIELQWVQTDFLRLSDNNNCKCCILSDSSDSIPPSERRIAHPGAHNAPRVHLRSPQFDHKAARVPLCHRRTSRYPLPVEKMVQHPQSTFCKVANNSSPLQVAIRRLNFLSPHITPKMSQ